MYNSNISLHPMAERNAPWLVPQDESRESSLYLLEQEEKEYNARLQAIATRPATNPIGFHPGSSSSHGAVSGNNSFHSHSHGYGHSHHGVSPVPRENVRRSSSTSTRDSTGGGTTGDAGAATRVASSSSSTASPRRHHHGHAAHQGSSSSTHSYSHSHRRRRSGSMRTYTPRASPGAASNSIPSHHMYAPALSTTSSRSSSTTITSPVGREGGGSSRMYRSRPNRPQRHSSVGSGIVQMRSQEDSFVSEFSMGQHDISIISSGGGAGGDGSNEDSLEMTL